MDMGLLLNIVIIMNILGPTKTYFVKLLIQNNLRNLNYEVTSSLKYTLLLTGQDIKFFIMLSASYLYWKIKFNGL